MASSRQSVLPHFLGFVCKAAQRIPSGACASRANFFVPRISVCPSCHLSVIFLLECVCNASVLRASVCGSKSLCERKCVCVCARVFGQIPSVAASCHAARLGGLAAAAGQMGIIRCGEGGFWSACVQARCARTCVCVFGVVCWCVGCMCVCVFVCVSRMGPTPVASPRLRQSRKHGSVQPSGTIENICFFWTWWGRVWSLPHHLRVSHGCYSRRVSSQVSLTYCLFNIHYAIKQTPGPKKKKALADQVLADQPDQTPSPHSQRSDIQNFRYVEF